MSESQQKLLEKIEKIQCSDDRIPCDKCGEGLSPIPIEQGQDDPEVALYCEKCKKTLLLSKEGTETILAFKIGEK